MIRRLRRWFAIGEDLNVMDSEAHRRDSMRLRRWFAIGEDLNFGIAVMAARQCRALRRRFARRDTHRGISVLRWCSYVSASMRT